MNKRHMKSTILKERKKVVFYWIQEQRDIYWHSRGQYLALIPKGHNPKEYDIASWAHRYSVDNIHNISKKGNALYVILCQGSSRWYRIEDLAESCLEDKTELEAMIDIRQEWLPIRAYPRFENLIV